MVHHRRLVGVQLPKLTNKGCYDTDYYKNTYEMKRGSTAV